MCVDADKQTMSCNGRELAEMVVYLKDPTNDAVANLCVFLAQFRIGDAEHVR